VNITDLRRLEVIFNAFAPVCIQAQREYRRGHVRNRADSSAQYDLFVNSLDPSSRPAEIMKNAGYHREAKGQRFERFIALQCKVDEAKMLLDVANCLCPEVVPFFARPLADS